MRINFYNRKKKIPRAIFRKFRLNHRLFLNYRKMSLAMIGFILVLILGVGGSSPVFANSPSTSMGNRIVDFFQPPSYVNRVGNLIAAPVKLDGYEIFFIAAEGNENTFPTRMRVELIENELQGIVSNQLYGKGLFNQGFQKETLKVTVSDRNGETIIAAYDDDRLQERQILTVTQEDARYNGDSIDLWANRLTGIIKEALIRAQEERQPGFLIRQIFLAFLLLGSAVGLSLLLAKAQKQLKQKRLALKDHQARLANEVSTDCALLKCPIARAQSEFLEAREKTQSCERKLDFIKLKRRLLELGQVLLGAGALTVLIYLFPWTRWLRFTILEKFLTLLLIFLTTGLIIRISSVLVDRYYQTRLEEESLRPQASQRLNSRFLTFSEIVKNAFCWGLIIASILLSLNLVGINVAAFLTGAGIFGIAVTLIAQNLVKDIISGLQILQQDRYAVGDYLFFEGNLGLVEKITLSLTQVRGPGGRLISIPNGEIRVVHNLSQEWARMDFNIKVTYDTDINLAMKVMQQIGYSMAEDPAWQSAILDPAVLIGVSNIDYTGVDIQFWMKVVPAEQWAVAREYRHRLKPAFDKNGIKIGIPQQFFQMSNPSTILDSKSNGLSDLAGQSDGQ